MAYFGAYLGGGERERERERERHVGSQSDFVNLRYGSDMSMDGKQGSRGVYNQRSNYVLALQACLFHSEY